MLVRSLTEQPQKSSRHRATCATAVENPVLTDPNVSFCLLCCSDLSSFLCFHSLHWVLPRRWVAPRAPPTHRLADPTCTFQISISLYVNAALKYNPLFFLKKERAPPHSSSSGLCSDPTDCCQTEGNETLVTPNWTGWSGSCSCYREVFLIFKVRFPG